MQIPEIIKWINNGAFIRNSLYASLLDLLKNKLIIIQELTTKYLDTVNFNFNNEYKNITENKNKPVIDITIILITSICLPINHIIIIESVLIRIPAKLNINILNADNWYRLYLHVISISKAPFYFEL